MDDNINPNVPGSNPPVGSDQNQGQMPSAGVPGQQPEPVQPNVEQPVVPSEPTTVPQPSVDVPEQTTSEPQVGA